MTLKIANNKKNKSLQSNKNKEKLSYLLKILIFNDFNKKCMSHSESFYCFFESF